MGKKHLTTVNTDKKTITLDYSVKPTATEEKIVNSYLQSGWKIRVKSEKRAKAAKERAEKTGFGKKKSETKTEKK